MEILSRYQSRGNADLSGTQTPLERTCADTAQGPIDPPLGGSNEHPVRIDERNNDALVQRCGAVVPHSNQPLLAFAPFEQACPNDFEAEVRQAGRSTVLMWNARWKEGILIDS